MFDRRSPKAGPGRVKERELSQFVFRYRQFDVGFPVSVRIDLGAPIGGVYDANDTAIR